MLLFVFVDGVGIGGPGPENPFVDLGGPILGALAGRKPELPSGVALAPTDATLGVAGLPQSATGQTAIFTGVNASALLGRHLWGFPNERLRVARDSGAMVFIAGNGGSAATATRRASPRAP